jgi:hypothetical protein
VRKFEREKKSERERHIKNDSERKRRKEIRKHESNCDALPNDGQQ